MKQLNFIKRISNVFAGLAFTASLALSGMAHADPLVLGTPLMAFDTGTITYDADSGSFSVNDARPQSIFDPTRAPPIGFIGNATVSGVQNFTINITLDSLGTPVTSSPTDLVIEGSVSISPVGGGAPTFYDGILLTGQIVSFDVDENNAANDTYTLTFSVTGGELSSLYPAGGIGINLDSINSTFDADFGQDFTGGAQGQLGDQEVIVIPDMCTVEVSATCLVNIPPASLACQAKIAATTLLYTGPTLDGATVNMNGSAGGAVSYENIDLISGVTVLTAATQSDMTMDARPDDLGPMLDIFIDGAGEWLHTSCSVPYVAGQPAPLNSGGTSLNWKVISFVDKNGAVVDSTPVLPSTTCEIPPSGAGCYANGSTQQHEHLNTQVVVVQ